MGNLEGSVFITCSYPLHSRALGTPQDTKEDVHRVSAILRVVVCVAKKIMAADKGVFLETPEHDSTMRTEGRG